MAGRAEESRGEEAGVGESWGEAEFSGVDLGDKRLAQRLQKLADDFSTQPQAPMNQASEDWAATKAAYRFFENPRASAQESFAAPRLRTSQRIEGQQVVLAIQDTTYLNYSHPPRPTGLGPIGDSRSDARGLILHSTLVVTPAGLPLGLLSHELWARPGYKPQSVRERKHTAIEEKESYRWVAALQETVARVPTTTTVVTLCDREADIYELRAAAQRVDASFVIRAEISPSTRFPTHCSVWIGTADAGKWKNFIKF
jgi:hypothetical protein